MFIIFWSPSAEQSCEVCSHITCASQSYIKALQIHIRNQKSNDFPPNSIFIISVSFFLFAEREVSRQPREDRCRVARDQFVSKTFGNHGKPLAKHLPSARSFKTIRKAHQNRFPALISFLRILHQKCVIFVSFWGDVCIFELNSDSDRLLGSIWK